MLVELILFLICKFSIHLFLLLVFFTVISLNKLICISILSLNLFLKLSLIFLWRSQKSFMFFRILFFLGFLNLVLLLCYSFVKRRVVKLFPFYWNHFPLDSSKFKKFANRTKIFACDNHIRMFKHVFSVFFHLMIS